MGSMHERSVSLPWVDSVRDEVGLPIVPPNLRFRKGGLSGGQRVHNDVCADPVEGVTGPAHTRVAEIARAIAAPASDQPPGAPETLLAALEKRLRSTFRRKNRAM